MIHFFLFPWAHLDSGLPHPEPDHYMMEYTGMSASYQQGMFLSCHIHHLCRAQVLEYIPHCCVIHHEITFHPCDSACILKVKGPHSMKVVKHALANNNKAQQQQDVERTLVSHPRRAQATKISFSTHTRSFRSIGLESGS